jgi:hypothetical protein
MGQRKLELFQSSASSPTLLEEILIEAVNSVNDYEGRSQGEGRGWKRTVTFGGSLGSR